jgi:uncharacterized protein YndB with AHSA1/START domain
MKSIEKSITVSAPLSEVWKAWTTLDGVKTFFAPEANIELWPGGPYEIFFFPQNKPGQRGAEGLRVLSFLPERMLSFEWNAPPEFPNVRAEKTWVVVEFSPEGKNQTTVQFTHIGWREGAEWDGAFNYFVDAWDIILGRLARRFSHGPIDWKNPWRPSPA